MKKLELRAGIIGSGFAARFHLDALRRVNSVKVDVVGAYSRDSNKLRKFVDEKEITAFDSMEALIESADVVHVCTPPVTHEPIAIAVLKNDKHVIIEKPFTGYFGGGQADFDGDTFSRETGLKQALASIECILNAEKASKGLSCMRRTGYMPLRFRKRERL